MCWVCLSALPSAATELVVLDRADFVSVLGRVDHLQQERDNLDAQITALDKKLAALVEQAHTYQTMLETLEAQLQAERDKSAILDEERTRLSEEAASSSRWSEIKNYGLAILGAVAMVALLL